jgi:hypothetical protein
MDWARASRGPLVIRRATPFGLRGCVYDHLAVPFIVSDNEAALWFFMSAISDAAPESIDDLVNEQRIPLAYALTAEEAVNRWATVGRLPRERAFADGRWKHCHLLPGAPRGTPPSTVDELRRRAARLLSPLNHFPMPSPRRYDMARDFGEASEVLAFVAAWLRTRYAQEPDLLAAFADFLAYAGPGLQTDGVAEPTISFKLKKPAEVVRLEASEDVDGADVYVASDDSIGSFAQGARVDSLGQLVDRLGLWLSTTDEMLLGNSPRFGGKAWLRFPLGDIGCYLNADTSRAGVEAFVAATDLAPFSVEVAMNRKGRCNKLHVNGASIAGLYGYTEEEQPAPKTLFQRA